MKRNKLTENIELGTAQNRNVQPDISTKDNAFLLNELEEKMSDMTEDNFDYELVKKYLDELQDRTPVMTDYDSSEEFARLQNEHSTFIHENADSNGPKSSSQKKGQRKGLRALHIAEVAVAAVLCLTVSAKAFNFHPILSFLNWTEDILQIQSNSSGIMELPDGSGSEYKSLKDALDSNGADAGGLPTWVPTDYTLANVSVKSSDGIKEYIAYYTSSRGDMFIRVTTRKDNWNETSEKNSGGSIYKNSGYEYYIVSNKEDSKAGWADGSYSYVIDGNITEEEIKMIVDSIQRE